MVVGEGVRVDRAMQNAREAFGFLPATAGCAAIQKSDAMDKERTLAAARMWTEPKGTSREVNS